MQYIAIPVINYGPYIDDMFALENFHMHFADNL